MRCRIINDKLVCVNSNISKHFRGIYIYKLLISYNHKDNNNTGLKNKKMVCDVD